MRRPSSIRDELLRTPVEYDIPRRKDNLFLWTVFLLLLVGFSMACWVGSYLIFSRPELPVSYKILRKIKKIDPPARFRVNAAPTGEFLTAEQLFERYNAMTGPELRQLNRELERAYLRNYPPGGGVLVPYVKGRFTIMDSYQLRPSDFVMSGVVALAVSIDFPKLVIEQLYPSGTSDAPVIKRNLQSGMDIELRRTFELTAVLHVTKLADGHIQLSVVPINYGRYVFTGTAGGFELQPPTELNVASGWPVVRQDRRETANQAYVDFRQHSGQGPFAMRKKEGDKPAQTALKGVDVPVVDESPTPAPGEPMATPAIAQVSPPPVKPVPAGKKPAVATATPASTATPAALLAQAAKPVLPALPVNDATTPRVAVATPRPVLKATSAGGMNGGVSLQPFLADGASAAPPAAAANGSSARSWSTYAAGAVPPGKSVRVNEIAALTRNGGLAGERIYLTGQFVVRAVGENKLKGIKNAVLRSAGPDANVRVIVEYPSDHPLPAEGSEISRDEQRPYQIIDVKQVADGTLNVFAREILD